MKTLKNWLIRKLDGVEQMKPEWLKGYVDRYESLLGEHEELLAEFDDLVDKYNKLKAEHDKLKAEHEKRIIDHEEYVKHVSKGYELDHRKDGSGVANLIQAILFDTVQDTIGDSRSPMGGANYSDVVETDQIIWDYANSVANEIGAFTYGIKLRNTTEAKWGLPRVRVGVSRMIAIGGGANSLLGKFARIWAKMHRDQRQKDLLTNEQIKQWRSLPAAVKTACNKAAESNYSIWNEVRRV